MKVFLFTSKNPGLLTNNETPSPTSAMCPQTSLSKNSGYSKSSVWVTALVEIKSMVLVVEFKMKRLCQASSRTLLQQLSQLCCIPGQSGTFGKPRGNRG